MEQKCIDCGKRVPWVIFFGNTILSAFQIFVGLVSGSKGLVADGAHSGADVVAALMMMISLGISGREDDETHPWGHGKIEFASALLIYTILVVLAIVLLIDAGEAIISGHVKPPHMAAFVAGVVAVFLNYVLSSYGFCAGNQLNSPSMIANANENRSDMLSSIAVVLGILGANMGFPILDSVAAVLVALIIFRTGLRLWIQAFRNLLDESLPYEKVKLLKDFILQYQAVKDISFLKTRRVGQTVWADIELVVSPKMSVQEGHAIAREVRLALIRRFRHIKEAVVTCTCNENPLTPKIVKGLMQEKLASTVRQQAKTAVVSS